MNLHLETRHSYFRRAFDDGCRGLVHAFALARGWLKASRRVARLISAALTHDFGIIELQRQISHDSGLTGTDGASGSTAARASGCCAFGIDDPVYQCDEDHHEYPDGSGYAGKQRRTLPSWHGSWRSPTRSAPCCGCAPIANGIFASQGTGAPVCRRFPALRPFDPGRVLGSGFTCRAVLFASPAANWVLPSGNTPGLLDSPVVAILTDPGRASAAGTGSA